MGGYSIPEQIPSRITSRGIVMVPANSGGAILSSGPCVSAVIKADVKNSGDIYVGGPSCPPYSGEGYLLEPGESTSMDTTNLNGILLVSIVSGDIVSYYATY
jgi:hypothetical protein